MSNCTSNITSTPVHDQRHDGIGAVLAKLLIIDRDPSSTVKQLRHGFAPPGYRVETATTSAAALASLRSDRPRVVVLDPQLPDEGNIDIYTEIRRLDPRIPVIFVTDLYSADAAIAAIKLGAYDYLFKPLDEKHLQRVVAEALGTVPQKQDAYADAGIKTEGDMDALLRGHCPAMREVYKSIGLVAAQDVNVLITGESGTGKELVARAIVRHSARSSAPFLALNCAAIPENLLESELFGHEKGAFSGADRRRIGKFEQYHGGTILLDEIGDMPLSLQAKILRLLQEQTFERVGGNETIRTNVRILASTHRDLKALSALGNFRADLYYRLSVFTIELPPLRERGDDISMLVHHFLRRYSRQFGRETTAISQSALARLQQYEWPGNIRELQSVLQRALLRANGPLLLPSFLPELSDASSRKLKEESPVENAFDVDRFLNRRLGPDSCDLYAELHREVDRHVLGRVLLYTRGNRHMAARLLGIARQTLRLKLHESGLHVTQSVEMEDEAAGGRLVSSKTDYVPARGS